METYIGTILMVGFNFAPMGWALCEGQLLPINQYQPTIAAAQHASIGTPPRASIVM